MYALYFNLPCVDELIKRLARGSVQQRLNQGTLRLIKIPYIDEDKQKELQGMVIQSREKEMESRKLLDLAIQIVETAIEKGEEAALRLAEP